MVLESVLVNRENPCVRVPPRNVAAGHSSSIGGVEYIGRRGGLWYDVKEGTGLGEGQRLAMDD